MTLAIFDLDHTLICEDSDNMWGEFVCAQGLVDAEQYGKKNEQFYQDYKDGSLDAQAYLRFVAEPLSRLSMDQLAVLHQQFMLERVMAVMQEKAQALLQKHRDQNHTLMIITATNHFITQPIAEFLKVDYLLAAELEIKDGHYTGEPFGVPTFKEGKVIRLQQWLEENKRSIDGAYFYSDSHNDLPLLKLVEHPVAVDPDDTLRQYAIEHDMPIISLRD